MPSIPPVSSRRPPKSTVKASDAMHAFHEGVLNSRKAVTLIHVGPNTGELETFIAHVLWEQNRNGDILFADKTSSTLFPLDQPNIKAIVYPAGAIPPWFQTKVIDHKMGQYLILAVVPTPSMPLPLPGWTSGFAPMCTPIISWPIWTERHDDHRELIDRAHKNLSMPNNRPVPLLDKSALHHLMTVPYVGSDDMVLDLKRALTAYIATKANGPLTDEHFFMSLKKKAKKKPHILAEKIIPAPAAQASGD